MEVQADTVMTQLGSVVVSEGTGIECDGWLLLIPQRRPSEPYHSA